MIIFPTAKFRNKLVMSSAPTVPKVAGKKRGPKPKSAKSESPQKSGNSVGSDGGTPEKKKKKSLDSRFGGRTEEEIMEMLLPDHLKPNLDIVFIGINPGLLSAHLGHHYCNSNNHFWPCMYESGLIPRKMTYKEDAECLDYGIGFTNIVPRTTRSSNDLTRKEIKEWSVIMCERMKELKPLIAAFNGKGIYEIFSGAKCEVGIQPNPLPGTQTVVYVMPSTSGRAASHPRRVDKLKFFHELKALRDRLQIEAGQVQTLDSSYQALATATSNPPSAATSSSNAPSATTVTSNPPTAATNSSNAPNAATNSSNAPSVATSSSITPNTATSSSNAPSATIVTSNAQSAATISSAQIVAPSAHSNVSTNQTTPTIVQQPVPTHSVIKLTANSPQLQTTPTIIPVPIRPVPQYTIPSTLTHNWPNQLTSPYFSLLSQGQLQPSGAFTQVGLASRQVPPANSSNTTINSTHDSSS